MSVVEHDIIDAESGFTEDQSGCRAKLSLLITTTAVTDGLAAIRTYLDGQTYGVGDPHPEDSDLILLTRDGGRHDDSDFHWKVVLNYGTPAGGGSLPNIDPLARDPEIRWFGGADLREYFTDIAGDRLVNSADEPFDVLPQRYQGFWSVEYTVNVATLALATYVAAHCAINSQPVTIDGQTIAARRGLLIVRDAPKLKENGVDYYRVTMEVLIHPSATGDHDSDEWDDVILDAGYSSFVAGVRTPARDNDGTEVRTPVMLDGDGLVNPAGPPVYNTYKPYTEYDWSSLFS